MDVWSEAADSPWLFALLVVGLLLIGGKLLGIAVRALVVVAGLLAAAYLFYVLQSGAVT